MRRISTHIRPYHLPHGGLLAAYLPPNLSCPITGREWKIQTQDKAGQTSNYPLGKAGVVGRGAYNGPYAANTHQGVQLTSVNNVNNWIGSPVAGLTVLWYGTAWATDTTKTRNLITHDDMGAASSQFCLRYESNQFQFVCNNGGGTYVWEDKAVWGPTGTTYDTVNSLWCVVGVIDKPTAGSTIRLYVNGISRGTSTLSKGTLFNPSGGAFEPPLVIGDVYQPSGDVNATRPAQGITHLAEVWHRRLGPGEIAQRAADPFAMYRQQRRTPNRQRAYPSKDITRGGGKRGG